MAQIKFDVIKAIREWHEEIVAEIREILEDTVGNETEQELAEQIFERLLNAELLRTPEDPKPDLGPLARGGFYHPTEREAI